jgi:Glycosyltransferase family 87
LAMTPYRPVVRVGNPPLFFWALQPLNRLPFQVAALGWIAAMYVLSGLGFFVLLRHLGWRSRVVPLIFFLAMPQVVLGAFYGNVIGLVFAAMALALSLASRSPVAAGVLLCLAWLKPPVALPLVVLIVLFHSRSRLKLIGGFAAATAGWLLLTMITTGWSSLQLWVEGLTRYSRDMAIQPDVASLAGLYVRWAPAEPRIIAEILILAGAAALTVRYWLQRRGTIDTRLIAVGGLWFVWMLATPYAHFFDEILLAAPLLAFFGVDGSYVAFRSRAVTLYLLFFSLLLISWMPLQANLLSIPLAVVALFVLAASKSNGAATHVVSYGN